jgi:hypothetical protein
VTSQASAVPSSPASSVTPTTSTSVFSSTPGTTCSNRCCISAAGAPNAPQASVMSTVTGNAAIATAVSSGPRPW